MRRSSFALHLVSAAVLVLAGVAVAQPATAAPPASPNTGARLASSGTPAPTGGGRTFYIDAVDGNDNRDGRSTANAWRTPSRVTQETFIAGDVIAFKRGQIFTGAAAIDESGTSSNRITVAAYGTGAPPVLKNPGGWHMLKLNGQHLSARLETGARR